MRSTIISMEKKGKKGKKKKKQNSLIMNRNRQVRPNHLHQFNPLFGVHGHHQQRYAGRGNGGSAQMHQHQIDGRVACGYFGEFGH